MHRHKSEWTHAAILKSVAKIQNKLSTWDSAHYFACLLYKPGIYRFKPKLQVYCMRINDLPMIINKYKIDIQLTRWSRDLM